MAEPDLENMLLNPARKCKFFDTQYNQATAPNVAAKSGFAVFFS